jgi:hypothetical protein
MEQTNVPRHLVWITAILAAAVILAGCKDRGPQSPGETTPEIVSRQPQAEPEPETEGKPDSEPTPEPQSDKPHTKLEPVAESELMIEPESEVTLEPKMVDEVKTVIAALREPEPAAPKPPDLGPPLVKDRKTLIPFDKTRPVWVDKQNKRVVMVGQICQRQALLELFACLRNTKEHEAVVSVDVEARTVHTGLLAVGAKPGHPAKWDPEYVPAAGTEIEVTVVWKDEKGKQKTARAQDWILDTQTKKAMEHPWVFAGSMFWKDEETGKEYYQAEGGDFICVANFPSAMLDLPIESSQANEALMFQAFTERIPPLGTPVTLLLTPKLEEKQGPHEKDPQVGANPAE